jgi:hypothetical protein
MQQKVLDDVAARERCSHDVWEIFAAIRPTADQERIY